MARMVKAILRPTTYLLCAVSASSTPATSSIRVQIENPAHSLDNFWKLIPCRCAQQHCHRRVEDLFYDVAT
jgi:hypothetical protein